MDFTTRAHDLLWLDSENSLEGTSASWVAEQWDCGLPVVVRRDVKQQGRIPVGVRGRTREQRAAGWVEPRHVVRVLSPEQLVDPHRLAMSPFRDLAPLRAARHLAKQAWPWQWGITGSVAYALATGVPVLHGDSDLDLTIRAPHPLTAELLSVWQSVVAQLPCRADTQLETPYGAIALAEWIRDGRGLLKTDQGPRLVSSPWHPEV